MTRHEMIATAHRALLVGPSPMLRHTPGCRRAEDGGVVMTTWGPHGPVANKVAAVAPCPPLSRVVEMADRFFGSESGGYGVVVEADAGHPLEAELRAHGWEVFEDEPALVMPQIPAAAPPLPPGLVVRPIRDDAGRRDLCRVLAAGFGSPTADLMVELPVDSMESLLPSLDAALDPDVALLVAYVDGQPAATAMLFVVGDVAGIIGVATAPAFRRRGIATATTWAALQEGARRACRCATLAALGASYDLYRKMGFVPVCHHRAYRPRNNLG